MSALDWTVAQALGDQPVDAELHRLRAAREEEVRAALGVFQEKHAKTEALRAGLESEPDLSSDPPVDTETQLAVVAVLLREKIKALLRVQRMEEAFRIRHGITRAPIAPETAQNLMFLAILLFIEAAINTGFFLSAHMAAGPMAALLLSLLISLTNVMASTCGAYFIGRWLHFGENAADAASFRSRRLKARILFGVFSAAMALFHITVGLVRAHESLDSVLAFHSLSGYIGVLTTPEALFLVLSGLCMSALAWSKGMHAFADPYPGYSKRHRDVLAAQDEILDLFDDSAEEIEARYEEALAAIDKTAKAREKAIAAHTDSVTACLTAKRDLVQTVGEAESTLKSQIAQVVGQHRAARGDQTPVAETALDRLASFQSFLDGLDPPPFYHPPDGQERRQRLLDAKSRALARLNALFEEVLKPFRGEDP